MSLPEWAEVVVNCMPPETTSRGPLGRNLAMQFLLTLLPWQANLPPVSNTRKHGLYVRFTRHDLVALFSIESNNASKDPVHEQGRRQVQKALKPREKLDNEQVRHFRDSRGDTRHKLITH